MNIIGISAYFHDAACCLVRDGRLVCAAEEERFSRVKHDPRLPWHAFRFCLEQGGLTIADIDCLAYYEDPTKKLARQIWMGLRPGASVAVRDKMATRLDAGRVEREIRLGLGYEGPVEIVDHHQSHAASAYYYSGFDEAAVMTVDGVGEWDTTSYCRGQGHALETFERVRFPHSLGLLYSTITAYLGFKVNSGEYKVMGLAPYGEPRYRRQIESLVQRGAGGQYELDLSYFEFIDGERMYSDRLAELLGRPPREPESDLDSFHHDVARSLQTVLEDVLLENVRYLHREVPSDNLCMAGGVALNCVANERILADGPFSHLFIQPAASDAGGALGAAMVAHVRRQGSRPAQGRLEDVLVGPSFDNDDILRMLEASSAEAEDFRGRFDALLDEVVERLAAGKVIGWFQGRMEFGPRALGARSILADPRRDDMRDRINALVKLREAFRPFAPAVLADKAHEHFALDHPSPFMLETCQVRSSLSLPSITHVNNSARVQTVDRVTNPRFAALLDRFEARTGCPILLNTSFNMRGEPIVCTPVDAVTCFVRAKIDTLVLEDFLLDRERTPSLWSPLVSLGDRPESGVGHKVYTLF